MPSRASTPVALAKAEIERLFEMLNDELANADVHGEVHLVGGAVMCLALDARDSTVDVDAVFQPSAAIRKAAARVASRAGVYPAWLNDAVKGYLGRGGTFDRWFERSHLQVFVAQPAYLLAMKCVAMRLGAEFHDEADVRFLLRTLNVTSTREALAIVTQYFDEREIPPKTRYALEEMLGA